MLQEVVDGLCCCNAIGFLKTFDWSKTTRRRITQVVSIQMVKLLKLSTLCRWHQPFQGAEWDPRSGAFPSGHSLPKGSATHWFCLVLNFKSVEPCSIYHHASGFFELCESSDCGFPAARFLPPPHPRAFLPVSVHILFVQSMLMGTWVFLMVPRQAVSHGAHRTATCQASALAFWSTALLC